MILACSPNGIDLPNERSSSRDCSSRLIWFHPRQSRTPRAQCNAANLKTKTRLAYLAEDTKGSRFVIASSALSSDIINHQRSHVPFVKDEIAPLLFLCLFSKETEKKMTFYLSRDERKAIETSKRRKKTLSFECQFLPTIIDTRRLEQVRAEWFEHWMKIIIDNALLDLFSLVCAPWRKSGSSRVIIERCYREARMRKQLVTWDLPITGFVC